MPRKKASLYSTDEPAKADDYRLGRTGLSFPDGEESGLAIFTGTDDTLTVMRVWQRRRSIDVVLDVAQIGMLRDFLSGMEASVLAKRKQEKS